MAAAYPQHIKDRAGLLRDNGATYSAIAAELGVSLQTVSRWLSPVARAGQQKYVKKRQNEIREYKQKYNKKWREKNPDKVRKSRLTYYKNRIIRDRDFALKARLRQRIRRAIKLGAKSASTAELLGCEIAHLVSVWNKELGDGWQLSDDLHIDHIRPCSSFNLSDPIHQRICFNWRNLQLLSKQQNLSKSDSWTSELETAWAERMRFLGFEGDLVLVFNVF